MRQITSIWITVLDLELMELGVVAQNGPERVFTTCGFNRVDECWEFAKVMAKGLGLSETEIHADVLKVANGLRRVK